MLAVQLLAASAALGVAILPARADAQQTTAAAVDFTTASKMIWTTMVALDQANTTGNYSVIRDLGAPAFQLGNSAATLAGTFQALRTAQVDLSNCLLVTPSFDFAPAIVQGGMLRLRGSFPLRPIGVAFDLLFADVDGKWRLFGMAVVPVVPQTAPNTIKTGRNTSTGR